MITINGRDVRSLPDKIQSYIRFLFGEEADYIQILISEKSETKKDLVKTPLANLSYIRKPSFDNAEAEEMHCEGMRGHFLRINLEKKEIYCTKCPAIWLPLDEKRSGKS